MSSKKVVQLLLFREYFRTLHMRHARSSILLHETHGCNQKETTVVKNSEKLAV